jgi:acetolactate synthase-1/3 small subunit
MSGDPNEKNGRTPASPAPPAATAPASGANATGPGSAAPVPASVGQSTAAHPAHTAPPSRAVPGTGTQHRHVLVAIVLNKPGVLNRVASLMRARNFNIESLAVSHTDQPDISRMTITLQGDDVSVEQAAKQLYRLIDVLKVQDVTNDPTVEHELALIKVRVTDRNRGEVVKIAELYRGRIVDISPDAVIVETTGTEAEVDAVVALLRSYGIKELVRTGTVVMSRGSQSIESSDRWGRGASPRASESDTQDSAEGASRKLEAGNK